MVKTVLAIDPGRKKCGIAVVNSKLKFIFGEVVDNKELIQKVGPLLKKYNINNLLIGSGTYSDEIKKWIIENFNNIAITEVSEKNTTMQARKRYYNYNPPTGLSKFLPLSFLVPPCPYDDYAALLIAEKFFMNRKKTRDNYNL
ncbi:MAG: pre-16S rRNA-processing nuclease YqgF [Atribacterota bacterium]|nr:pre-16S rRNA-processing nuclease YqgF [Atribacterota bacterium]